MTEETKLIGRRNFLKAAAAIPVAGALAYRALSAGPVRVALIGAGGQGRVLLENIDPAFLRLAAVCDIFPPSLKRAQEMARQQHGREVAAVSDHRQLLERQDIEAVLIATPLSAHTQIALDVLAAGKHVFIEKAMAARIEDCRAIVRAGRAARRVVQVGYQRAYNPLYHEAYEVVRRGDIGEVYHVRAVWHRNSEWRRRVPPEAFDPRPWGYDDLERLINWRLYSKHSRGLWTELVSHQTEVVNWFCNRLPQAVMASGGIHRYHDGREVADHVYAIFEYPQGLTLTCSSIQSNAHDDYSETFMGTKGTLILTGETQAYLFYEGDREAPTTMDVRGATGPLLEASASRARDALSAQGGGAALGASVVSAYRIELQGFAATIRGGATNLCDGEAGLRAVVPILMADDAVRAGGRLSIPPESYNV
ncbi:MAG: Gfo/Idh/MocA family oxidoreductase [Vicinamibacteria bacterium]|jgi:predicted dehydrogenase|nr:Gfo/Idh/MocA family oxidoreductase [Vicinamibacteria bacterium]